jgi:hypothetical protein
LQWKWSNEDLKTNKEPIKLGDKTKTKIIDNETMDQLMKEMIV